MLTKPFEKRTANLEQQKAGSQKIPRQDFTQADLERIYAWVQHKLTTGGFDLTNGTENALVHLLNIARTQSK